MSASVPAPTVTEATTDEPKPAVPAAEENETVTEATTDEPKPAVPAAEAFGSVDPNKATMAHFVRLLRMIKKGKEGAVEALELFFYMLLFPHRAYSRPAFRAMSNRHISVAFGALQRFIPLFKDETLFAGLGNNDWGAVLARAKKAKAALELYDELERAFGHVKAAEQGVSEAQGALDVLEAVDDAGAKKWLDGRIQSAKDRIGNLSGADRKAMVERLRALKKFSEADDAAGALGALAADVEAAKKNVRKAKAALKRTKEHQNLKKHGGYKAAVEKHREALSILNAFARRVKKAFASVSMEEPCSTGLRPIDLLLFNKGFGRFVVGGRHPHTGAMPTAAWQCTDREWEQSQPVSGACLLTDDKAKTVFKFRWLGLERPNFWDIIEVKDDDGNVIASQFVLGKAIKREFINELVRIVLEEEDRFPTMWRGELTCGFLDDGHPRGWLDVIEDVVGKGKGSDGVFAMHLMAVTFFPTYVAELMDELGKGEFMDYRQDPENPRKVTNITKEGSLADRFAAARREREMNLSVAARRAHAAAIKAARQPTMIGESGIKLGAQIELKDAAEAEKKAKAEAEKKKAEAEKKAKGGQGQRGRRRSAPSDTRRRTTTASKNGGQSHVSASEDDLFGGRTFADAMTDTGEPQVDAGADPTSSADRGGDDGATVPLEQYNTLVHDYNDVVERLTGAEAERDAAQAELAVAKEGQRTAEAAKAKVEADLAAAQQVQDATIAQVRAEAKAEAQIELAKVRAELAKVRAELARVQGVMSVIESMGGLTVLLSRSGATPVAEVKKSTRQLPRPTKQQRDLAAKPRPLVNSLTRAHGACLGDGLDPEATSVAKALRHFEEKYEAQAAAADDAS